ncbi:hypothetical protein [Oryzibacter oryziterrae]|uniref:hypothetical protein n=1 Tax=Oryzibacter oryziterrae TaxID=2766474 RepID=UPI001F2AFF90|nr:hypothetical protein [Oryzibacter oryziterrae]
MLRKVIFTVGILGLANPAMAFQSCADAGIGLESLVPPAASHSRYYFDNAVSLYVVDTIEPACCSAGLAVVLPDPESPQGDFQCLAILNYRGLDLENASETDEGDKGIVLEIPTGGTLQDADSQDGRVLRLRITPEPYTVSVE